MKPSFDVCIFVSSEDDKYIVSGGIVTYIGVFTKFIRKLFPSIKVFWISKSHTGKRFIENDERCGFCSKQSVAVE